MTEQRQDAERWRVVRELFEDCHEPGTQLSYDDVTLQKVAWCENHSLWRVFVTGLWVDTIRVIQFRSVRKLDEYMASIEDADPDPEATPTMSQLATE